MGEKSPSNPSFSKREDEQEKAENNP